MQRNVWVKISRQTADAAWSNGKIRVAFGWTCALELARGVPLQSGQRTFRRIRKEINEVMP
jgi:hypothetical protein